MARQSQETKDALAAQAQRYEAKRLDDIISEVKKNDEHYYIIFVTKEEFQLIKNIVLTLCGMILVAFVTAVIKTVLT